MKPVGTHPLRVLIVGSSQGVLGGIEAYMAALATDLRSDGFDVRLVYKVVRGYSAPEHGTLRRFLANCPCSWTITGRASLELLRAVKWADVVHAQNAPPDVAIFAWCLRRPLVLTIHHQLSTGRSLRLCLWRLVARLSRRRWFNSRFVAQTWGEIGRAPDSAVIHATTGVHFDFAPFEPRAGFVFAARSEPGKGADILIDAYLAANLDPGHHPLHMIGDGSMQPILAARVSRDTRANGIHIHGFVDEIRKRELIRCARWLVAPPHLGEDMGLTPIEARSLGIPCIVTRDGGLLEVAGRDALICLPNDVPGLAARLREAAAMEETSYRRLAEATFAELREQVVDHRFYENEYAIVRGRGQRLPVDLR